MNIKLVLRLFLPVLAFFSCTSQTVKENFIASPNIILIYLDDMGYGDLTLTGTSEYKTPNIDKLANNGIFFTHYYSPQAVCSASRAGLLTGCYPNRIGITGALSHRSIIGISDQEETIAEILKKKGYVTAIFGKWHLGFQNSFYQQIMGLMNFTEYRIPMTCGRSILLELTQVSPSMKMRQ